jgi:gag-polyprotein putative aspartyl protease
VSIHNQIALDAQQQPSPGALVLGGCHLPVEIHLHPILAQHLQQQQPSPTPPLPPVVGRALIDTGATFTAIDRAAAAQLQLVPVDTIQSGTAGGQQICPRYPARLLFPGLPIPPIDLPRAVGVDLSGQGFVVLLGRDFLARCVLTYNGPFGHFILSF